MAAKKKTAKKPITQPELIDTLVDAGYELDGFTRKGDNLIIRLTPHDLIEEGHHIAESICTAANLQTRCTVFPEAQRNLLILTVLMPPVNDQPNPSDQSETPTPEEEPGDA